MGGLPFTFDQQDCLRVTKTSHTNTALAQLEHIRSDTTPVAVQDNNDTAMNNGNTEKRSVKRISLTAKVDEMQGVLFK